MVLSEWLLEPLTVKTLYEGMKALFKRRNSHSGMPEPTTSPSLSPPPHTPTPRQSSPESLPRSTRAVRRANESQDALIVQPALPRTLRSSCLAVLRGRSPRVSVIVFGWLLVFSCVFWSGFYIKAFRVQKWLGKLNLR